MRLKNTRQALWKRKIAVLLSLVLIAQFVLTMPLMVGAADGDEPLPEEPPTATVEVPVGDETAPPGDEPVEDEIPAPPRRWP